MLSLPRSCPAPGGPPVRSGHSQAASGRRTLYPATLPESAAQRKTQRGIVPVTLGGPSRWRPAPDS
eukprot:8040096-Alexandrium_andersonii.AAC.1